MEYTAHIRETDGREQTVGEHTEGVKKLSIMFGESYGVSAVAAVAALVHDIGKLTVDFSEYIHNRNSYTRGDIDHSYAGAKYIMELAEKVGGLEVDAAAKLIAHIVISHHGLHDWIDKGCNDYFKKRISKSDRYDEIHKAVGTVVQEDELISLLKTAADEHMNMLRKLLALSDKTEKLSSKKNIKISLIAFYMGMYERLCQSVLVDADRTDTSDFMSGTDSCEADTQQLWESMRKNIRDKCDSFRADKSPLSVKRTDISDRCAGFASEKRGICRLIVPTGGGKTLSSVRFAADYCSNFKKKKIIYVAPFMSILEQNSGEIGALVEDKSLFLEHYSNIVSEIDDAEELADYELKCDKWDSPVIATTMVQFLNTLFLGKMTSVRRFHRLADSVIIIDEVQSIPLKCVYLFNLAMNFLSGICGCTIVLCSATQPDFEKTAYPIILDEEYSMTGDYRADFQELQRTELIPLLKTEGYTFEEAAAFSCEKYLENGNLLLIANTKKSVYNLFVSIKGIVDRMPDEQRPIVIHLSTNMCPRHRKDKINEIRELLDKKMPVICVTTQLIEAGVDISFNCVVRSLAGMDNFAQAAGRCNRNGRDKIRPVYVINLCEEKLAYLKEITAAQDISRQFLSADFKDYLGVEVMSLYFRKLYKEFERELGYKETDMGINTTLLNLLSLNSYRVEHSGSDNKLISQAFATAGKLFCVISENTTDILVPYNEEAEEIILELNSEIRPGRETELLRKAQKYTVSVYYDAFKALCSDNSVYELRSGGVFALKKEFYDPEDLGIKRENIQREVLIF